MQDPVVGRIFLGATQLNKALDTLDEAAEMHPLWWGRAGRLPQVFRHATVACPECSQKNQASGMAMP